MVKGHAKMLFSRGHPQACGQVDQICLRSRGSMPKNKTKTISVSIFVKNFYEDKISCYLMTYPRICKFVAILLGVR